MLAEVLKGMALGAWEKYSLFVKVGSAVAVALTVLTLSCRVRSLNKSLDEARAAVDTAVAANEQQTRTIHELEAQRVKDAQAVQDLEATRAKLQAESLSYRRRIADLEKTDDTVRAYLNTRVPPGIASVLGDQGSDADGDGKDRPSGSPAGGVSPASAGPSPGQPRGD